MTLMVLAGALMVLSWLANWLVQRNRCPTCAQPATGFAPIGFVRIEDARLPFAVRSRYHCARGHDWETQARPPRQP